MVLYNHLKFLIFHHLIILSLYQTPKACYLVCGLHARNSQGQVHGLTFLFIFFFGFALSARATP